MLKIMIVISCQDFLYFSYLFFFKNKTGFHIKFLKHLNGNITHSFTPETTRKLLLWSPTTQTD